MKAKLFFVTAGLLGLTAAVTLPAIAGDWNNGAGTLRDNGSAAVPVPAPSQVPDDGNSRGWYLRGTIGYGIKSTGTISSAGTDIGSYSNIGEVDGPIHGGLGYGAYMDRNWRWDLTGDFHSAQPITRSKARSYTATQQKEAEAVNVLRNGATLSTRSWDISSFAMERTEDSTTQDHTFLANLYYEPFASSAFRPYVGAGVGFAINTLNRSYKETGECTGSDQYITDPFTGVVGYRPRPVCTAPITTVASGSSHTEYGVGLAAALMAGVGYEIKNGFILDVGYRLLWQGNSVTSTTLAGAPGEINKLGVSDRTDHEIRTSVRWNIN
jgi:opacity protein-like surface antigen